MIVICALLRLSLTFFFQILNIDFIVRGLRKMNQNWILEFIGFFLLQI